MIIGLNLKPNSHLQPLSDLQVCGEDGASIVYNCVDIS
jgi:hypothetical protein